MRVTHVCMSLAPVRVRVRVRTRMLSARAYSAARRDAFGSVPWRVCFGLRTGRRAACAWFLIAVASADSKAARRPGDLAVEVTLAVWVGTHKQDRALRHV